MNRTTLDSDAQAFRRATAIIHFQTEVFDILSLDMNVAEDHNLGELEFMLENERKKFKEMK